MENARQTIVSQKELLKKEIEEKIEALKKAKESDNMEEIKNNLLK